MFPETIEITVTPECVEEAYAQREDDTLLADCCPLRQAMAQADYIGSVGLGRPREYVFELWVGHRYYTYWFDEAGNDIGRRFDDPSKRLKLRKPVKVTLTKGRELS